MTSTIERTEVATVSRRNGAWIIIFAVNELTDDLGHHELVDCAGSLELAKRITRRDAAEAGYFGAARWFQEPSGSWVLEMCMDTGLAR